MSTDRRGFLGSVLGVVGVAAVPVAAVAAQAGPPGVIDMPGAVVAMKAVGGKLYVALADGRLFTVDESYRTQHFDTPGPVTRLETCGDDLMAFQPGATHIYRLDVGERDTIRPWSPA